MQKHILIADDNTLIRKVVKDVLTTTLDIDDCQEAANGREAIERAEQSKPDLIILDIAMPVMDGITAAKHLKESMPETPIILFTMYDLGRDRAKELGVDVVVAKPDGLEKLAHEVESLLAVH